MPGALSIKIGDFLYKNFFPVYNAVYPVFKRRQDKEEIALLKANIKPGNIVLDIGANIGFYTKILSALTGEKGKVYAFEPDAKNFSYLQKNASLENVQLINKAVSDQTGTITLYQSPMLNVDHKTYPTGDDTPTSTIGCIKADDALAGIKVDFIKMDIQGYEYFAFKGMEQILTQNPDVKILSEFFPYGIQQSGVTVKQFLDFLWQRNFNVYLFENGTQKLLEQKDIAFYEKKPKEEYYNIFIERKNDRP